ncbi:MAG TPA: FlgD immunoglobulin-like domain containing protein [Bacteroidia bacterium]|nr:FlgD immunoglobulin-like domain containing protein [Bacteroidia bacterium]
MKRILLLSCMLLGLVGVNVGQTIQVKITLDVAQLANPDCWLNQGVVANNKVYIHSGLCASNAQLCFDSVCQQGSNIWQTVVGNWGNDDGVGLMTFEGNNKWSITMIPTTYYNQPGVTPYTIGMVFRNSDGLIAGKDNACSDIFVKGLNTSTPVVVGCDNQPFGAVSVERTVLAGVKEPSYLGGLVMSPNPFRDQMTIDYHLQKKAAAFSVKIFSALGQEVVTLASGSQVPGSHRLTWDGRNAAGQISQNGLYYMVMSDGNQMIATEKMLLMR